MLVKNLTPFLFASKVSSTRPPQPEMTCVVRGRFSIEKGAPVRAIEELLGQGMLSDETFAEDDEDRRGEVVYPGDFADFKMSAEVLLSGKCHAPLGKPVTECPVVFRVGGWSKSLRVMGRRTFTGKILGSSVSPPEPFTEINISYSNAFGGPAYPDNPLGKGHKTDELPHVYHPRDVLTSPSESLVPASFAPIASNHPHREARKGKEYGPKWRATRAPFYAEDFDYRHFNSAPPDQWLPGYLQGDEEVFFQNLHHDEPLLTTSLPGLRIRVFVKQKDGAFREARMVLDTLYAEPEERAITLTWRGLTPIQEIDMFDVSVALVASEPLSGPALSVEHYREILDAFEKDPAGLSEKLKSVELAPGLDDAIDRFERERRGEALPEVQAKDPVSALVERKLGLLAAPQQVRIAEAMRTSSAVPGNKIDFEAELSRIAKGAEDTPPAPRIQKAGVLPNVGLRHRMRDVLDRAARLKKTISETPLPDDKRKELLAKVAEMERLPFDPKWKEADPTYSPPIEPLSDDEPGPGKDLKDRDFTGKDLSNRDLSFANFEGALLVRTDLTNSKLTGANLKNAILFRAKLTGADLTSADLTRVNASAVSAEGACFERANIEQAYFGKAVLKGARFVEATGEYAMFEEADLTGAAFDRATLPFCDFSATDLAGATLFGATLTKCRMISARAQRIGMTGAKVKEGSFQESDMTGARLDDLVGHQTLFLKTVLDGADMRYSVLPECHFFEAVAQGALFFGADLRGCRFYRARLDRAIFTSANLMNADLLQARLDGAQLQKANLYRAELPADAEKRADFKDANLKLSTLRRG